MLIAKHKEKLIVLSNFLSPLRKSFLFVVLADLHVAHHGCIQQIAIPCFSQINPFAGMISGCFLLPTLLRRDLWVCLISIIIHCFTFYLLANDYTINI